MDTHHSQAETRMIVIGPAGNGRMMFVGFTMRMRGGEQRIRPVTARQMREKEVQGYAETSTPV